MERALVTGVTGFVGSHLGRVLVGRGVEVHAVVRPGARIDRIPDLADRLRLHVDDGATDGLRRIVDLAAPQATFHLATNFVAEHGPDDVGALVADNVGFPSRLVDALAVAEPAPFVNVGTAWQHVDGAAYRPKNLYAATKQAFEDILAFYATSRELPAVTVNLYDTYGPLDHRGKLVSALVRAARSGDVVEMSSGRQLIDLVHVDDVVQALLLAAEQPGQGHRVHSASSGRAGTLRDLVEVVEAVADRPLAVRWGARPDREGEMLAHWDAGPSLPGWSPTIDLRTGLAELLAGGGSAGA